MLILSMGTSACGGTSISKAPPSTGITVSWIPCNPNPYVTLPSGDFMVAVYLENEFHQNYWMLSGLPVVARSSIPERGGVTTIAVSPGWYVVRMPPSGGDVMQVQVVANHKARVRWGTGC